MSLFTTLCHIIATIKENFEAIIAISALFLTLWQFFVQRKHNKISVMPHLIWALNTEKTDNKALIEISIQNNGLGPAFIKSYDVFVDGEKTDFEPALEKAIGPLKNNCQFGTMGSDSALSPNEKKTVLKIVFPIKSENELEETKAKLDALNLKITYHCAYGTFFKLDANQK